jgi:sulfur carrier protein
MWDDGAMDGGQAESIAVVLNGAPHSLPKGSTVLELLAGLGRDPRAVAVERNGDLLPRRDYGATRLAAGDRLEVVHFVQGGH